MNVCQFKVLLKEIKKKITSSCLTLFVDKYFVSTASSVLTQTKRYGRLYFPVSNFFVLELLFVVFAGKALHSTL